MRQIIQEKHKGAPPKRRTSNIQRPTSKCLLGRSALGVQRWAFIVALLCVTIAAFAARYGGNAEIAYESVNASGVSYATNGNVKLGASIGQANLINIGTNASGQLFLNGFWKAEDGCTLYNPVIVDVARGDSGVGITFLVVNSNTYSVTYIDQEHGGLLAGTGAITNVAVTPFEGTGSAGTTTTVWHNVVSSTNSGRYYVIRCE